MAPVEPTGLRNSLSAGLDPKPIGPMARIALYSLVLAPPTKIVVN